MKKYQSLSFLFSILIIAALACNLPSTVPTPTQLADVDATLTSLALTQAAVQKPPPAVETEFTTTITLTPMITLTLPPSVPTVSVSVNTNCRAGPGVVYDYLAALLVGEKAEVVGKYTTVSPSYWIIKKGSITCWLWGQYATVEGDTSKLPEMTPPPSPTPTSTPTATLTPTATATNTPSGPSFTLSFAGVTDCSPGDDYATLKWVNTGSVVFESAQTTIEDLDTATNLYNTGLSNAPFGASSPGCGAGNSSLGVGNTAYSSYYIGTPAPAGHNIRITVKLCSQDGAAGDCETRTLNAVLP